MFSVWVCYEDKKYEFFPLESHYMFPFLLRYGVNSGFDIPWSCEISVSGGDLELLLRYFTEALSSLLDDCYTEPVEVASGKHHGRFRKFEFCNRIYKVDYRKSNLGKLMYCLRDRISLVEDVIHRGGTMVLGARNFSS